MPVRWSKEKFKGMLLQLIKNGEGSWLNDELLDELNSIEGEGHHDELQADIELVRKVLIRLLQDTPADKLRVYARLESGKMIPTFEYPDWETK